MLSFLVLFSLEWYMMLLDHGMYRHTSIRSYCNSPTKKVPSSSAIFCTVVGVK